MIAAGEATDPDLQSSISELERVVNRYDPAMLAARLDDAQQFSVELSSGVR